MAAMFEMEVMSENLGFNNVSRKRVRYSLHSYIMAKFMREGICSVQVPYVSTTAAFLVDVDLVAVFGTHSPFPGKPDVAISSRCVE